MNFNLFWRHLMKLYLKLFSIALILMYCFSPLVAAEFNDINMENIGNMEDINNTSIENGIDEVSNDSIDDEGEANFNVYVDPCSQGDDLQVHIDSDYAHPMNVSLVLYNAAGYPIYTLHNIDMSSHGSAVIPGNILFYCGEYKIKAIFECENYTAERTVTFNVE